MQAQTQSTSELRAAFHDLGVMRYEEVWALQRECQRRLIENRTEEIVFLCEHEPIITLGSSTKDDSIIADPRELREKGVAVIKVERGGDATWHGPGQLVCYPIINLAFRKQDVGWYMRSLERVMIETLARVGIVACRVDGKTGVWIEESLTSGNLPRKIGSLGVRISRWCTMHGLALNVLSCKNSFALLHPCGLRGVEITSVEEESRNPTGMDQVKEALKESIQKVFYGEWGYSIAR